MQPRIDNSRTGFSFYSLRQWLSRAGSQIGDLGQGLWKIHRLMVSKDIKKRLRQTVSFTFFLKQCDRKARLAEIAGYRVKYLLWPRLTDSFREIFLRQAYRFSSSTMSPLIIDGGSNIGLSVLFFKTLYPHSTIMAFEPDKEAYDCLGENVNYNRLSLMKLFPLALANREEEIVWKGRKVMATRLPRHIEGQVDFLKLDIGDAANEVMADLVQAGKLPFVEQMLIVYPHHRDPDEDKLSRLLTMLEESGFGYQLESSLSRPLGPGQHQEINVYAYRKRIQKD